MTRPGPAADSMQMTCIHHYTACVKLSMIHSTGHLQPSNAAADRERPLLWFSTNQRWEPTATKSCVQGGSIVLLTLSQQLNIFGCCRFSLPASDPRLMSWEAACRFAGTGYTLRRQMEVAGRRLGARPLHWFALAGAVDLSDLGFSVFDGQNWQPADISKTAEAWKGAR